MQDRTIYITKFDLERLEDLLAAAGEFNYRDRGDLEELEGELEKGKLVDSKNVPSTVVTMNSRVELFDLDENKPMIFTLTLRVSSCPYCFRLGQPFSDTRREMSLSGVFRPDFGDSELKRCTTSLKLREIFIFSAFNAVHLKMASSLKYNNLTEVRRP